MYKQVARPKKTAICRKFFSQVRQPAKIYLCLPSTTLGCITDAISSGAISEKTKVIAFEHDKTISSEVEEKLRFIFEDNFTLHKMDVCRGVIKEEVDLAYIDLCGQISADFLLWLTSLNFSDNALVAFTFARTPRSHNTFYQKLLADNFQIYGQTQFTGGAQPTERTLKICEAISYFVPFRWNITEEYNDTRMPMLFLGGYLGRAPSFRVRTESFNFERFEQEEKEEKMVKKVVNKIQELAKNGVERPQQIGGLRIMYNKLSPAQKAWVRRKAAKEMEKIEFN